MIGNVYAVPPTVPFYITSQRLEYGCDECVFLTACQARNDDSGCGTHSLKRAVMTFAHGTDEQIAALKADPKSDRSMLEWVEKNIKRDTTDER